MRTRHAHLVNPERFVATLTTIYEREYQQWRTSNPNATTLEQLAEIYRQGSYILRNAPKANR